MKQEPPGVMSFGVVVIALGLITLFAISFYGVQQRQQARDCASRNGTYEYTRGTARCVRDGRIIISWEHGGRVDNP